eukprot:1366439-Amorphochlora_amoeboformis.AAC.3
MGTVDTRQRRQQGGGCIIVAISVEHLECLHCECNINMPTTSRARGREGCWVQPWYLRYRMMRKNY